MSLADVLAELAQLRDEVAELKRAQTTIKSGTVTAVDPDTAVFTVELPDGGGELDLAAPPHFLPAAGDEVSLQVVGASPTYLPARVAADSITTTELDPAVVSQIESGGVTYFTQPTPPVYSGDPDTAIWIDSSQAGGNRMSRWDGAAWAALPFGPAAFQAGAVTATVLAADAVNGKTITGGKFYTAPSASGAGVRMYQGVDGYNNPIGFVEFVDGRIGIPENPIRPATLSMADSFDVNGTVTGRSFSLSGGRTNGIYAGQLDLTVEPGPNGGVMSAARFTADEFTLNGGRLDPIYAQLQGAPGTTQDLTTGVWTAFGLGQVNVLKGMTAQGSQLIVQEDGWYQVWGLVVSPASGTGRWLSAVYLNGTTTASILAPSQNRLDATASTATITIGTTPALVHLHVNDTLILGARQDSGATRTVDRSLSYLNARYVGAA